MSLEIESVLSQNITLVYDSLDLQTVDRNSLRDLVGTQPMMIDTPEMIVVSYPTNSVFIQIGDRRIRVTLQQPAGEIGSAPIWDYAVESGTLVPATKSKLVAYGFNYDVAARLPGIDARVALTEIFVADLPRLEEVLGGELASIMPRLVFQREQARCDLVLEPTDGNHIKVHLNTHFEWADIALPSAQELRESFLREYERWKSTLRRLLEREA